MKESTSQSLPGVGDVFLGKYIIENVLGAGGFGTVFAAKHIGLEHKVAIKVLRATKTSTDAASTTAVERFVREARLAAKIESEHVARVHDVARMSDGSAYMVMEYLEGRNLQSMLAEDGPLPIAKAIDFTLQACAALEAAHRIGVVHRDVKPANLFCVVERRRQVIKLIDFGIARWRGASASPSGASGTLTSSLAMMGSPRYMAPEQLTSSRDVDARADIWSLGVTLFELLANAAPFTAQNLAQLCARIQSDAPRSLRSFRPDVTPEIERVVARCLQKLPDDRFASVQEVAVALGKKSRGDDDAEETKQNGPRRATTEGSPVIKIKVEEEDGEGPTVAAPQNVALPLRAPALDEVEEPTREAPTRRLATVAPSSPARRASAVLVAVSIVSIGLLVLVVGARLVRKSSSPMGPLVPSPPITSPPTTAVVAPSPTTATTSLLVAPPADSPALTPSLPAAPVASAIPRARAPKPRPSTATSSRLPDDRE